MALDVLLDGLIKQEIKLCENHPHIGKLGYIGS